MSGHDIDALIDQARSEEDADRRGACLTAATEAGPTAVRERVERLLASDDVADVELAADLVSAMPQLTVEEAAQLRGMGFPIPDTLPFPDTDRRLLAGLLADALARHDAPDVVESCVIAAGKLERPEALEAVLRHVAHDDEDVREACAWALPSLGEDRLPEPAIAALVTLAGDPVAGVRDWALAGLGGCGVDPVDTPETRRVFRDHVDDDDEGAREEAIRALGLLGDVEMLARSLDFELVSTEAVELAARLGDQRLHQPLERLREHGWARTSDPELAAQLDHVLRAAIQATAP